MSYRAKAFPYPVLAPFNDDYTDGSLLSLVIDARFEDEDSQALQVKYRIDQTSNWLDEFILDGGAQMAIDVECRSTMLRSYVRVSAFEGEMAFAPGELYGKVTFTPVVVATASTMDYRPEGVNGEFGTGRHTIMEGDLLAIGEGSEIDIEFGRSLRRDLVTIKYTDEAEHADTYSFDFTGGQILIVAGVGLREPIEFVRAHSNLNPFLHMSIYKDCIAAALRFLAEADESEREDRPWARRLLRALDDAGCALNPGDPEQQEISAQILVASAGVKKVVNSNG